MEKKHSKCTYFPLSQERKKHTHRVGWGAEREGGGLYDGGEKKAK